MLRMARAHLRQRIRSSFILDFSKYKTLDLCFHVPPSVLPLDFFAWPLLRFLLSVSCLLISLTPAIHHFMFDSSTICASASAFVLRVCFCRYSEVQQPMVDLCIALDILCNSCYELILIAAVTWRSSAVHKRTI